MQTEQCERPCEQPRERGEERATAASVRIEDECVVGTLDGLAVALSRAPVGQFTYRNTAAMAIIAALIGNTKKSHPLGAGGAVHYRGVVA